MPSPRETDPSTPAIRFEGVEKRFGDNVVLHDLDFDVARGDRVTATLRTPSALADLQARYPQQLWVARLDVTDDAAIDAVLARDYPLIQGSVLMLTFMFMLVNILIDVIHATLDPRIRLEGR